MNSKIKIAKKTINRFERRRPSRLSSTLAFKIAPIMSIIKPIEKNEKVSIIIIPIKSINIRILYSIARNVIDNIINRMRLDRINPVSIRLESLLYKITNEIIKKNVIVKIISDKLFLSLLL